MPTCWTIPALITAMQSENLQAQSEVLPLMGPLGTKKAVALMQTALKDKEFPKPERYALLDHGILQIRGGRVIVTHA